MINVTKTFLPPVDEFNAILKKAWDNHWITNRGELVKELENKLKELLGVPFLTLTNNGTVPLQIAIKALGLRGEIITTPFSYVATTSTIVWENCQPVFVDIDPDHLTIDESKIEAAITPSTTAILATHVFGNPCAVNVIEDLAKKHQLKVIYDAAHCFGVKYQGQSVFNFGDVSTCSFHATKLFHTAEGGAMFASDSHLHNTLFYHHNFGHKGPTAFQGLGINAKMSELSGAMGLSVLPYLEAIMTSRKAAVENYQEQVYGSNLRFMKIREGASWNYSYFPVIFESEAILLKVIKVLNENGIMPRRYFYPSLSSLNYVKPQSTPIADKIAEQILCLPLYHDLSLTDIHRITNLVKQNL
ncbi:MAG TPA: DegT/DnrJ/EryC1/StrS family aminotransferase [Bacteroidia bacterium]|nr:DegT/DnrJ/EryC1/StrS family aminotransferase [Bacteroidia bacterium]